MANHWDEQGILPKGSREEEGQWRKFTLVEVAWIRVALHLREFGISLPVIAEIKKCVMEWDEKAGGYPFFEFFFLKAIENDVDHYVAYTSDGHADLVSGRELELLKQDPKDMLLISLKSVATKLGFEVADITPSITVSEAELSMLSHLRGADTKEVKATKRNGRVEGIESIRTYPDDSLLKVMTGEIRQEGGHGAITRTFADGQQQSITVSQSERFK